MDFRLSHQPYRKKPFVARWSEEGRTRNRFFATDGARARFIENYVQQDSEIPPIEPRKLYRWQEASRLAPDADPVEVYRYWLKSRPKTTRTFKLADASRAYLRSMADLGRDTNHGSVQNLSHFRFGGSQEGLVMVVGEGSYSGDLENRS